jgi:hypothetical protein
MARDPYRKNCTSPAKGDQFVWTALMQVPSGNRFQYQLSLNFFGRGPMAPNN